MANPPQAYFPSTLARVLLCGYIAGAVYTFLSYVVLALVPIPFLSEALQAKPGAPLRPLVMIGSNLAAGTSAVFIYFIARRAGLRFTGAVLTSGCIWWVIASQQSAKWLALSGIDFAEVALVAALTLPAMLASVLVGGWLFEKNGTRSSGE
ncbi:MAG: hypothetical protein V4633_20760 [Pseudomonadota bacterium]